MRIGFAQISFGKATLCLRRQCAACDELHKQCLFWLSKGIEQLTAAMVMLSCDKSSKDRESKAMKYAAAE
jgi:hypothetical protein